MSYKSHVKSSGRAFDHLYDPNHKSNEKTVYKLNRKALSKTAPIHIIPCYSSMFSDLVTKTRNFYFYQQNSLPISDDTRTKLMCDRAMNTNHFVFNPILAQREEICNLDISYQQPPLMMKSFRSVKCQTKYRESAAQTDMWLPNAKLRDGEISIPEIAYVNCETDPGIREVEAVERLRIRRDWENQLPTMTQEEFPMRIAQLEAFEWENLIAREMEINESQMNRMEQVDKLIEERQEMNRSYSNMMIANVHKRNIAETEQKKSQMEILYARKMRRLMEKNEVEADEFKLPKIESSFIDMLQKENDVKVLFKSKIPLVKDKTSSKINNRFAPLWKPKEKTKEIAHGVRSDKNLTALSRSLAEISIRENSAKINCRTKREKKKENKEVFYEIEQEPNEDLISVAKSVKGAARMKVLNEGINNSYDKLQSFRQKFPIDCVRDILPEQYINLFEEKTKSPKKSQVSFRLEEEKVEENEKEITTVDRVDVDLMIDDILNHADEVVQRKFNNQLLREAEEERSKRQDEIRQNEKEKAEQAEIQRKLEEKYKKIADKVLEKLLSCAIDKISEQDSVEFIRNIAREFDENAWSTTESASDTVEKLVREFLLPEIEKRVESHSMPDVEICALVAAHDAFENAVESISFEGIHDAEIICEDLLEEIFNKIEL